MKFRHNEKRVSKTSSSSELVDALIDHFDLGSYFSFGALCEEWETIAGHILSVHTKPISFENNIVYIRSDHSVFSNDVIMMKGDIIKKIESRFGQKVKDVRIVK